jgi:enamine deaminase RidA (YjgF/YER057c/UK114 family)
MKRTAYQPPDSFVPAGKTYSHGIIVQGASRTLYVAGQTSRDAQGKVVFKDDAAGQTSRKPPSISPTSNTARR